MTVTNELTVSPRTVIGKSSRRLAGAKQIPAVLYGVGREAMPVAVDRHDFEQWATYHSAGSGMVELKIEGEKNTIPALVRDIQHSAVKGTILHIDFLAVAMDKVVSASVPLRLLNDPEGVREGGVVAVSLHEITVEALPAELPEAIEWDISALKLGDTLHLSDITAPAGITFTDDPESIVVSVQLPRLEVEEEADTEATEPELVGAAPEDDGE